MKHNHQSSIISTEEVKGGLPCSMIGVVECHHGLTPPSDRDHRYEAHDPILE